MTNWEYLDCKFFAYACMINYCSVFYGIFALFESVISDKRVNKVNKLGCINIRQDFTGTTSYRATSRAICQDFPRKVQCCQGKY